ncbi:MAG: hypothetical protein N3H30_02440 [Candidatus Micrarchaeota archaeon]|nr:hypothetical protein [Candidatus Micrarchaeota archaeon]
MVHSYAPKSLSEEKKEAHKHSHLSLCPSDKMQARKLGLPRGIYNVMLGIALACTVATASAQELPFRHNPEKCSTSEVQFEGAPGKVKIGTDYELERAYDKFKKGKLPYEDLRAKYVTPKSAEIIRANGLPPKLLPKVSDEILQQLECGYQHSLTSQKEKAKVAVPAATPAAATPKMQHKGAKGKARNYATIYHTMPDGSVATEQRFAEPAGKMVVHKLPKPPKVIEKTVYAMPHEEYAKMQAQAQETAGAEKTIGEIIEEKRVPEDQLTSSPPAEGEAAPEYKTECKGCVEEHPNEEEVARILADKEKSGDKLAVVAASVSVLDSTVRNRISELDFGLQQVLSEGVTQERMSQLLDELDKIYAQMSGEINEIQKQLDECPRDSGDDRKVVAYLLDKMSQLDIYVTQKKEDYSSILREKVAEELAPTSKEVFETVDSFEYVITNEMKGLERAFGALVIQFNDGPKRSPTLRVDEIGEEPNNIDGLFKMGNRIIQRADELVARAENDRERLYKTIDECRKCTDTMALKDKIENTISYASGKRDEFISSLSAYSSSGERGEKPAEDADVKGALSLLGDGYLSEASVGDRLMRGWGAHAPLYLHLTPPGSMLGFTMGGAYGGHGHEYVGEHIKHIASISFGPHLLLKDGDGNAWHVAALVQLANKGTNKALVGGEFLVSSNVMGFKAGGMFNERAPFSYSLDVWDTSSKYPVIANSYGVYAQRKDGGSTFECAEGSVMLQLPFWYGKPAYLNAVIGGAGRYSSAWPNLSWDASAIVGASLTWKYVNFGGGALLGSQYSQLFVPGVGTYTTDGRTYIGSIQSSLEFEVGYVVFGGIKAADIKDMLTVQASIEYIRKGDNYAIVPQFGIIIVW